MSITVGRMDMTERETLTKITLDLQCSLETAQAMAETIMDTVAIETAALEAIKNLLQSPKAV